MSLRADHSFHAGAPSLLAMASAMEQPGSHRQVEAVDGEPAPRRSLFAITGGLMIAGAVLGGALAVAWPGAYVATSEIMIAPTAMQPGAAPVPQADVTLALVENKLRVLRSATMLDAAAERLNLTADAEFNGEAAGLSGLVELVSGDGASSVERRRRETIAALEKAIEVRRVGNSSIVAVSARTSDPVKSALVANTLTELFVAGLDGKSGSAARLGELEAELATAERAVADFRTRNGLPADEEMALLDERLAAIRARAAALDAQVASARGLDPIATGSVAPAGPSSAMEEARARHAGLKQRVESLSARLGPRHPDLINAQAELDGARREMEAEARRVSASLHGELNETLRQEKDLATHIARLKEQEAGEGEGLTKLRELEREAEMRRTSYEEAVRASAGVRAAVIESARVISPAEPPLRAAGPSVPALSLAGALGGLLAGLGFAGWRRAAETEETAYDGDAWDDYEDAQEDAEWDDPRDPSYEAKEADAMYPYPAHAHAPAQAYGPAEQHLPPAPVHAAPGWYPASPHDPWAHMRAYAPPAPSYAPHYPYPPVQTVVYVPMPAHHAAPAVPAAEATDRRTDAAIEEIRQSLRALREAIEDFADDRYGG